MGPGLTSGMSRLTLSQVDSLECPRLAPNALYSAFPYRRAASGWESCLDVHLDPLGGLSGDMFVAALLDAFPEHWPHVQSTIASLKLGEEGECALSPHRDHAFAGRRFLVGRDREALNPSESRQAADHRTHSHEADRHHEHFHARENRAGHKAWADIRAELDRSGLDADVKNRALAIFKLLAEAEAKIHGVEVDAVTFHEVGAVDSIVDIVAAAQLISLIRADRWTSAPLPIGSGRIHSAHGVLPVPAPAAALLLQGLPVMDDGVAGERVTPTGAALAAYLIDRHAKSNARILQMSRSGIGFGGRTLPGLSNCLRVLAFDEATPLERSTAAGSIARRQLAVITFEVDDQSPEDLAAGLDHIRELHEVFDVTQTSVVGKKGRMAAHVQILVSPNALEGVIVACFEETTTIGLRYQLTEGAILRRRFETIEMEGGDSLKVKIVERPGGVQSGKAEAADVAHHHGHLRRAHLRGEAVALALNLRNRNRTGDDDAE
jgi:pyridinium-3,5-bisthiocarboxylic acid mononucleotide nickel chelatase